MRYGRGESKGYNFSHMAAAAGKQIPGFAEELRKAIDHEHKFDVPEPLLIVSERLAQALVKKHYSPSTSAKGQADKLCSEVVGIICAQGNLEALPNIEREKIWQDCFEALREYAGGQKPVVDLSGVNANQPEYDPETGKMEPPAHVSGMSTICGMTVKEAVARISAATGLPVSHTSNAIKYGDNIVAVKVDGKGIIRGWEMRKVEF